jgi:hypothetical protein
VRSVGFPGPREACLSAQEGLGSGLVEEVVQDVRHVARTADVTQFLAGAARPSTADT